MKNHKWCPRADGLRCENCGLEINWNGPSGPKGGRREKWRRHNLESRRWQTGPRPKCVT